MTRGAPVHEPLTLHVTFCVMKRDGRKEMRLQHGAAQPRKADNTMVKGLGRAFRWNRMQGSGKFTTVAQLVEREGIATSYMTGVVRLTLVAPKIVEAIPDGKQGPEVMLGRALEPSPAEWTGQVWFYTTQDQT